MKSKEQKAKEWDALLAAGYVVELSEEQIALARDRMRAPLRPFSYANDDHLKGSEISEALMRSKFASSKKGQ